ncbi:nitrate- and nitrite sensing domain-containing protein [Saccharopolyspora sp. NPDC047091]|uniref:sensor histidine kinase n=1 Tax=Saccharopolyspora sp. NPDC047091 TaxID=3155924 RepID=UPI0033D3B548
MTAPTPRKRALLGQWRNWSLPVKFAAVVLVPVVFAVGLGISQIRWQVAQATEYERVAHVLDGAQKVEPLVAALQDERNAAVLSNNAEELDLRIAEVDAAFAAVDEEFEQSAGPGEIDYGQIVDDRHHEVHAALDQLRSAREAVRRESLSTPDTINAYSAAITSVLSLDRALTSTVSEPSLAATASALQDMLAMMEEVRLQQAWVLSGLSQGQLAPQSGDALQGSRARLVSKIADARATVARHWQERLDATTQGPEIIQRNAMLTQVLMAGMSGGELPVSTEQWNGVSDQVVELIDDGHNDLADEVRAGANTLREDAGNAAGWDSALLLAALIIAAAVITMISRQLIGSLRLLRQGALDAAQHGLPDAVAGIRSGEEAQELRPLPVQTTEEVGQVARAFDQVQEQALRLAAEQASLRHGYSESFVGVSRRSQGLLERQLRLFEQLEQDEEDPDQLSRLFQLDHLATRMRRNNENLMVLSGSDLARRFVRPTELGDMLRAAVSEIEQYPRVVVQPPPQVRLLGHAASDLVRLMAELMDNAANFSAPDTSVTVSSYQAGDGSITVDVLDEGIGMGDQELAAANERMSRVDENDLATSRRMGLFVVSRLALRHGVTVRLHGGPDVDGVRATVNIPAEHVVAGSAVPQQTSPATGGQRNGVAHHDLPTSGTFGTGPQPTASGTESGSQHDDTGFVWSAGGDTGFSTADGGFGTAESETGFSTGTGFAAETGFGTASEPAGTSFGFGGADPAETGFSTAEPDADRNTFNTGFLTPAESNSPLPKREPAAGLVGPSQQEPAGDLGSLFTPVDIPEQADSHDFSADWTSSDLAWPPAPEETSAASDAQSPIFEEVSTQWFQPITDEDLDEYAREQEQERAQEQGRQWPGDEQATSIMDTGSWSFSADSAAEAEAGAEAADTTGGGTAAESEFATSGFPGSGPDDSGFSRSGPGDSGFGDNGRSDSGYGDGGVGDSGFGETGFRESGSGESGSTGSGLPRRNGSGPAGASAVHVDEDDPLGIGELEQDGAGETAAAAPSTSAERSPQELSRRLADLQGGLRFGRNGAMTSSSQDGPAEEPAQDAAGGNSGWAGGEAAPASNGNGDGGWSFATDESWRQAEAVTSMNPTSFTDSGLPRRTPKAQLAPGSAQVTSTRPEGQRFERDANALRGRLSSFQSGVERGRHRAPDES